MTVRDSDLFRLIESIGEHYKNNINNRFLRKALMSLDLDKGVWERVEGITGISDLEKAQGIRYQDLYESVLALAVFVQKIRRDVIPNLRHLVGDSPEGVFSRSGPSGPGEKILVTMAVSNFPVNVKILADQVNELYLKTVELDKSDHPQTGQIFKKIPELARIGQLLIDE